MFRKYRAPGGAICPLYNTLLKQTHLLVAGATGSGKSVIVNGLIHTAITQYTPSMIQFIFIDPKRVELSEYRNMPHCVKYASEPADMIGALQYAMDICENRYKIMQNQGARKYTGAQVYVIIDEWADLMTTQKKAVKPLIQRLAQIGRAAGIHIILCTQTPVAVIIPTEIKCNFDSRVGLRTRSGQDSRNIIGVKGLETLPRYGQGVIMTPEDTFLSVIPMYSDTDRARVIEYWNAGGKEKKPGLFARLFKGL